MSLGRAALAGAALPLLPLWSDTGFTQDGRPDTLPDVVTAVADGTTAVPA